MPGDRLHDVHRERECDGGRRWEAQSRARGDDGRRTVVAVGECVSLMHPAAGADVDRQRVGEGGVVLHQTEDVAALLAVFEVDLDELARGDRDAEAVRQGYAGGDDAAESTRRRSWARCAALSFGVRLECDGDPSHGPGRLAGSGPARSRADTSSSATAVRTCTARGRMDVMGSGVTCLRERCGCRDRACVARGSWRSPRALRGKIHPVGTSDSPPRSPSGRAPCAAWRA